MKTRLLTAAALAAFTATPLAALDIAGMTEEERLLFRSEVRAYLMDNPEVLIEAINVLERRQADAQAAGDVSLVQTNADALFRDDHSFVAGNPEGDVTVVEFLDYRCGYCRKAHPEVTQLIEGDGNIRLVVKEFPILGEQSVLASRFAIAVGRIEGDEAYWDVHDELMTLRGEISEQGLSDLSEAKGWDTRTIFTEMNSPEIAAIIDENRALAQRLQINGTPSFVFEDQMVRGYVPLDAMNEIVEKVRGDS
jgi:protein-disulfide isomerase